MTNLLPMKPCRSCGASILWAVTVAGRRIPVDASPSPRGNIALTSELVDGVGTILRATVVTPDARPPEVHLSHFATCPQAAQHRKSR